jgi:hypothetical protein
MFDRPWAACLMIALLVRLACSDELGNARPNARSKLHGQTTLSEVSTLQGGLTFLCRVDCSPMSVPYVE